jgi:hypothetical protein
MREIVKAACHAADIVLDEAGPVLRAAFRGEHGQFMLFLKVDEERHVFSCTAIAPIEASARVDAVMELLHRLNQVHDVACFDVGPDDGVIRCRVGVDVEGAGLSQALCENVLFGCAAALDRALPAIMAVVVKGLEPRRALQAIAGS